MKPLKFETIKTPHLFAHRGGPEGGQYPENTIYAFRNAVKQGYKFIETDVIATRDGKVICYHGSLTWGDKRVSGLEVRRKLQQLTYNQVRKRAVTPSEEMPLLSDVITQFPGVCFSVDVKTKEVVEPVIRLIKSLKAEDRVIITSFSLSRSLKADRLLRGRNKRAALCLSRISLWSVAPFNKVFLPYLKTRGVKYLEVSHRRINESFVDLAHRHGMKVYAWTVNDEETIRKMLSFKVDGIMSDQTKLLLEITKSKKA